MKASFVKSIGRLQAKSLPLLAGLILSPLAVLATDSGYTNTGTIFGTPPNVDATNFYNYGTWNIFTEQLPYQTANTLNYVNGGTMTGSVGWEFDFGPLPSGGRGLSASFFNDSLGTIEADDGYILNPPRSLNLFLVSYLTVQATNLVNKGTLIGGAAGNIELTGVNVDLAYSTLGIGSVLSSGSPCSVNDYTLTNFTAATAIYDNYWATNGLTFDSSTLWTGSNVSSPIFTVDAYTPPVCLISSNIPPLVGPDPIAFVPTFADSIINAGPLGTNGLPAQIFGQAVFVATSDPNLTATNHFLATGSISNLFTTAIVGLTSKLGGTLYLVDTLASSTNSGILNNATVTPTSTPASCSGPTYRPANYILERGQCQSDFTNGAPGDGPPITNFFYASAYSNKFVQGEYAAYSAYIDNLARDPFGGPVSGQSGQIIIHATNLDLTGTTVDNQGAQVVIQANNLQSSTGAVVSCQNLSFNLGSAAGNLNVTGLAANATVPGLHGNLYAWSALWTNGVNVVTGSGTNATTNTIELDFYVLMVDARGLSSTVPVIVQDLILHSTNMTVSDSMTVTNSLLFDGQSLTLQGSLNLSGNLQDWKSAVAPSLRYFTNNGTLTIPQDAHFGDDTAANYAAFVNNGVIQEAGGGETINSAYYQENGGIEGARNGFSVTASTGLVQNAIIASGQNLNFAGGTFQLANSMIFAGNTLNFSVTNSLSDNGSGSFLTCSNGFNLLAAPQSGSLLASTITDIGPGRHVYNHAWAGGDFGPAAVGTSSNVAIGTLSLVAQNPSQLPIFHFYGTTGSNAMYVKTLDLSQLTTVSNNLPGTIHIDPGMKIYFSQVLLGFAPTSGQAAANFLTNTFPGQFIQDPNVGQVPSSAITISSTSYNPGGPSFVLTWNATTGATYSILKTNVLTAPFANWPVIKANYPAGGAAGGPISYTDTTTTISPAYYRVRSP